MMDRVEANKKAWEEPKLIVHGDVEKLTQQCDKRFNGSDGFTFMGQPIVCRSAS
jgi:hypothetical protein